MAREWPMPSKDHNDRASFIEQAPDLRANRQGMTDAQLARELDIGVQEAHRRIEDVNEHRSTDLDFEDSPADAGHAPTDPDLRDRARGLSTREAVHRIRREQEVA